MRFDKYHHKCISNGIKVYPIWIKSISKFRIEVNINGLKKKILKDITQKEINEAMTKTYIFYAKKLLL